MSRSGLPCYRNGGCGPYEMLSCTECPASKSDYLQCELKPKPQTNADRIRAMTDEELAQFIRDLYDYSELYKMVTGGDWLAWLKQETIE